MSLRIGLVGAGGIGAVRARACVASPDATLVAVADPDAARAGAAAAQAGAAVFRDHGEMLEKAALDAVIVSAPPQLHERLVLDALAAGRHVLCEKPLSNSVESCRRLVEAARAAGRVLATGYNHRYFPAIRRVRQAVTSGEIGSLDHVRAFAGHMGLGELAGAPWLTDPKAMGGGTLLDNGTHVLDLARHVLGEVEEVSARVTGRVWNVPGLEDNAFVLLRSREGRIASLHSTWTEWRGYRFWVAAYGDRGTAWAYYAPMASLVVVLDRPGGKRRRRSLQLYPRVNLGEKLWSWRWTVVRTFVEELRDFRARIEGRAEHTTIADGFAGLRAVEIAHAAYRSSAEGTAIRLCEPF